MRRIAGTGQGCVMVTVRMITPTTASLLTRSFRQNEALRDFASRHARDLSVSEEKVSQLSQRSFST